MQCTALVIDDEPLARKRMISLLEPYSSEIEILGEAGSGAQAVKMIHEMIPDVVFLDSFLHPFSYNFKLILRE